MAELSLDDSEAQLLKQILEDYYQNLRVEIQATDTPEYKQRLHAEEATVQKIIGRL